VTLSPDQRRDRNQHLSRSQRHSQRSAPPGPQPERGWPGWLTHRLIEAPMQRLGRRVTRRLDVRFGPDTVASQPDGVVPAAAQ